MHLINTVPTYVAFGIDLACICVVQVQEDVCTYLLPFVVASEGKDVHNSMSRVQKGSERGSLTSGRVQLLWSNFLLCMSVQMNYWYY